jgi:tetratricopeptide (TPR) repeat protein
MPKSPPPIVTLALVFAVSPAMGQSALDRCFDALNVDASVRIEACSTVLDAKGTELDTAALAQMQRGLAYQDLGDTEAALVNLDRAIAANPISAELYVGRASFHLVDGNADAAFLDIERALGLDPTNSEALMVRGSVHCVRGETEQAFNDFLTFLMLNDNPLTGPLFQQQLVEQGFYEGPIDGLATPQTIDATQSFVEANCSRDRFGD